MTTNLKVPTIHSNGTSKNELLDGYRAAYRKVAEAITALQQTAPHGRDYYVQADGGALSQAMSEHIARLAKLETVKSEIEAIAIAIQEGN